MSLFLCYDKGRTFKLGSFSSCAACARNPGIQMSRDGGDDYHRGTCWYVRELAVPEANEGKEVWLKFDGAAMSTGVYLNGEHLAHHEVAFPRFA